MTLLHKLMMISDYVMQADHAIECGFLDERSKQALIVSDNVNTLIEELCRRISTSED